jgi:hypothetical protein
VERVLGDGVLPSLDVADTVREASADGLARVIGVEEGMLPVPCNLVHAYAESVPAAPVVTSTLADNAISSQAECGGTSGDGGALVRPVASTESDVQDDDGDDDGGHVGGGTAVDVPLHVDTDEGSVASVHGDDVLVLSDEGVHGGDGVHDELPAICDMVPSSAGCVTGAHLDAEPLQGSKKRAKKKMKKQRNARTVNDLAPPAGTAVVDACTSTAPWDAFLDSLYEQICAMQRKLLLPEVECEDLEEGLEALKDGLFMVGFQHHTVEAKLALPMFSDPPEVQDGWTQMHMQQNAGHTVIGVQCDLCCGTLPPLQKWRRYTRKGQAIDTSVTIVRATDAVESQSDAPPVLRTAVQTESVGCDAGGGGAMDVPSPATLSSMPWLDLPAYVPSSPRTLALQAQYRGERWGGYE